MKFLFPFFFFFLICEFRQYMTDLSIYVLPCRIKATLVGSHAPRYAFFFNFSLKYCDAPFLHWGCAGGVSESGIGELHSNSSRDAYVHFRANKIGKCIDPFLLPPNYV